MNTEEKQVKIEQDTIEKILKCIDHFITFAAERRCNL